MKLDFKKISMAEVVEILSQMDVCFWAEENPDYCILHCTYTPVGKCEVRMIKFMVHTSEGIAYADAFPEESEWNMLDRIREVVVRLHTGITKNELFHRIIFGLLY